MFQGVHETICFGPAATGWSTGEAPLNQIVFIGRDLNRRVRAGGTASGACPWLAAVAGKGQAVHLVAPTWHTWPCAPPSPTCPSPLPSPPLPLSQELAEGLRSCVWTPLPEGWTEHHDAHTNRPYYVNSATGAKQWERPETACALVQSTETSHKQPKGMQPRKNGSEAAEATAVQA